MKRIQFLILAVLILPAVNQTAKSAEIIDQNTVYAPKINICVSSFGGLIQSQEIIVTQTPGDYILHTKNLLTRWIYEYNSAGFYLQEFESSQYYWQFVETKQHIGAVLFVTGDAIDPDFYEVLGGGLNISGRQFYGLDNPTDINGDVFSFVVSKQDFILEHFENWKFSEEIRQQSFVSTALTMNLLTKSESKSLKLVCKRLKGELGKREFVRLAYNDTENTKPLLKRETLLTTDK